MLKGKIYRNKPIQLENNTWQSDQPKTNQLRRVMSNTQLSYLSPSQIINSDDFLQQKQRNNIGKARQYVEKMERRMNQRYNNLEKRYNLSLSQMEKIIDQKDMIIHQLEEALQEKQRIIENYKKQNEEGLLSSRLMDIKGYKK